MNTPQPRLARRISSFTRSERMLLLRSAHKVCGHPGLDIRARNSSANIGRILVITPKRMGSAPQRNRARRRLKALFYQEALYAYKIDLIVYCKTPIQYIEHKDLIDIIRSALTEYQQQHTPS